MSDLLRNLREAIENEGRMPSYHREVMERHRREWPTLWTAIDALLAGSSPMSDLTEAIASHDRLEARVKERYPAAAAALMPKLIVDAARLVASGEVVAKTDLREIRWCTTHGAEAIDHCWLAAYVVPEAKESCRIVSAGLYLEGETE